jgi:hypothetical protein
MSLCNPIKPCDRRMEINGFSAPNPSCRQLVPCSFALRGPREFGHSLAFSGKSSEFFRRVHWVVLPMSDIVLSNLRLHFGGPMIAPTGLARLGAAQNLRSFGNLDSGMPVGERRRSSRTRPVDRAAARSRVTARARRREIGSRLKNPDSPAMVRHREGRWLCATV